MSGVSSQPVLLCHSLPAFSSHLTPSKEAKRVTPSLFQLEKLFFLKEDVSHVPPCGTLLFAFSISLASLFSESPDIKFPPCAPSFFSTHTLDAQHLAAHAESFP